MESSGTIKVLINLFKTLTPRKLPKRAISVFCEHLSVSRLRNFQNVLPRASWITIYKSFSLPRCDYGDIIYHRAYNFTFPQKKNRFRIVCPRNYRCCKGNNQRKTLSGTVLWIISIKEMAQKTLLLF